MLKPGMYMIKHKQAGYRKSKLYGPYDHTRVQKERDRLEVAHGSWSGNRFSIKRVRPAPELDKDQQARVKQYDAAWDIAKENHEWNVANVPAAANFPFDPYVEEDVDEEIGEAYRIDTCALSIYKKRQRAKGVTP